jgi:bud emergence protein 1
LFGIHEGDIETDIDPSMGRPDSPVMEANEDMLPPQPPSPQQQPVTPVTPTPQQGTIKVKIIYKDEIFAIKVPVPSTLEFLRDKIVDRLGFDVDLSYKEGSNLMDLTAETFASAVKLGKLTVVATAL